MRAGLAPGALLAVLLAACSLTPVDVEPRQALLSQLPRDVPTAPTLPSTLLVNAMIAEGPYDTARMAYGTKPLELAYFARTEWAGKPAAMLDALLVRTLERTHRFRAVAAPPDAEAVPYVLESRLLELRQDFSADPATVTLIVRAQLREGASQRVIATQEFDAREPLSARSAYAGAVAANAAAARVLEGIARFVVQHTG